MTQVTSPQKGAVSMHRRAPLAVVALLAAVVLTGCGGQSDYCAAVQENEAALNGIRTGGTSADFEAGGAAVETIAPLADEDVEPSWEALSAAITAVLDAQAASGATIEQMNDEATVRAMDQPLLDAIRAAYTTFDETAEQRARIVEDIREQCKITLTP